MQPELKFSNTTIGYLKRSNWKAVATGIFGGDIFAGTVLNAFKKVLTKLVLDFNYAVTKQDGITELLAAKQMQCPAIEELDKYARYMRTVIEWKIVQYVQFREKIQWQDLEQLNRKLTEAGLAQILPDNKDYQQAVLFEQLRGDVERMSNALGEMRSIVDRA